MSDVLPDLSGEEPDELICFECLDCGACSRWHAQDDHLVHADWSFTHRFKTGHVGGYRMWTARRGAEVYNWGD